MVSARIHSEAINFAIQLVKFNLQPLEDFPRPVPSVAGQPELRCPRHDQHSLSPKC